MIFKIDGLLGQNALDTLNRRLSEFRFDDGRITAGGNAQRVKNNLQLTVDAEPRARELVEVIVKAMDGHQLFLAAMLPRRISAPMFNRYERGMTYGDHVDSALMGPEHVRSDIAVTVFLSRPEDYDGGELVVEEASGAQRIKLAAGSAVAYPATSVHRVEPVTRGMRQASIFWVESLVRDDSRRRILFDLHIAINRLMERSPDWPEIGTLSACYHNLMRQWVGT